MALLRLVGTMKLTVMVMLTVIRTVTTVALAVMFLATAIYLELIAPVHLYLTQVIRTSCYNPLLAVLQLNCTCILAENKEKGLFAIAKQPSHDYNKQNYTTYGFIAAFQLVK